MGNKIHIFLVHGTILFPWQRSAVRAWTHPQSALCQSIGNLKDLEVVLEPFPWSGRNSLAAREAAAIRLAHHLERVAIDHRVIIIGHSHGGNVGLRACNHISHRCVSGIVCLSTPFLHMRQRVLCDDRSIMLLSSVAMLMALSVPLAISDELWFYIVSGAAISFGAVAYDYAKTLENYSNFIVPPCLSILNLRCVGDEVAGLLGFACTLSSTADRVWTKICRLYLSFPTSKYVLRQVRNDLLSRGARYFVLAWIVAWLLYLLLLLIDTTHPETLPPLVLRLSQIVCLAPLFVGSAALILAIMLMFIGVIASLPLAFLLLFSSMPFGGRPGLRSLKTVVYTEVVPPGFSSVEILPGMQGDNGDTLLNHSQSHSNPACICRIVDWIAGLTNQDH